MSATTVVYIYDCSMYFCLKSTNNRSARFLICIYFVFYNMHSSMCCPKGGRDEDDCRPNALAETAVVIDTVMVRDTVDLLQSLFQSHAQNIYRR